MFSKKATKIDKIFTVDLTLCSKRQTDGEDFVNFCGLLRKYKLYKGTLMYCDEGGAEFFWDAHHIRKNVRGRVPKSVFQLVVGS